MSKALKREAMYTVFNTAFTIDNSNLEKLFETRLNDLFRVICLGLKQEEFSSICMTSMELLEKLLKLDQEIPNENEIT